VSQTNQPGLAFDAEDVMKYIDEDGRPTQAFRIVSGVHDSLPGVRSLNGVVVDNYVGLNIPDVVDLDGVILGDHVRLLGAESLMRIGTAKIGKDVTIEEVNDGIDLGTPKLSRKELEIVRQIPLDKLNMRYWHSKCGTAHCIGGWVQVICGLPCEGGMGKVDFANRLPSLLHCVYMIRATNSVREMLQRLQALPA